jgi:hypothetical protein
VHCSGGVREPSRIVERRLASRVVEIPLVRFSGSAPCEAIPTRWRRYFAVGEQAIRLSSYSGRPSSRGPTPQRASMCVFNRAIEEGSW